MAMAEPRIGSIAVHPVLLAAHPALALWAANVTEVQPSEVWPAVWIPTAVAVATWLVATFVLRSGRRAAMVASTFVTLGLYVGRWADGLTLPLIAGIALLGAVGVGLAVRRVSRETLVGITAMTNVLALVLVAFALPSIASAVTSSSGRSDVALTDALADLGTVDASTLPDILYIIPDRYPRADTLLDVFDHDNGPWLASLEQRGFQVAERSLANYPSTGMSLAATWNLQPVDELITEIPDDPTKWAPAYALLRDHALGRTLTSVGYDYVHMGTWWSPTSRANSATTNLRLDGTSEFVGVFQGQIAPAGLGGADGEDAALEDMVWHERSPLYSLFQLQELKRLGDEQAQDRESPRFILAHITLPHEPYVFEVDGSPVSRPVSKSRTREDNFLRQLGFVNNELDDILDRFLAGPPETWPIIVIQSDEGPHPEARTGGDYDWRDAPVPALQEKLRTLSAILLPGRDLVLPEDLRGINTWRILLDEILGTDLGTLDAPIMVYGPDNLYEHVDVTDRVLGVSRPG